MIDGINIMYGVGDIERDGENIGTGEDVVGGGDGGDDVDGIEHIIGEEDGNGKNTKNIIDVIVMLEYFQ